MILDSVTPAGWYSAISVPIDEDREISVSHVPDYGFIITAKNGETLTRMALSPEATQALTVALIQAMAKWGPEDFKVWTYE